jgi:ketosteroid isomerase-like protein
MRHRRRSRSAGFAAATPLTERLGTDHEQAKEEALTMTTNTHTALLRRAYAAFNARDVEAGVALMDPDVDWPNVAEGGLVHGRDAVREHWRDQFGQADLRIDVSEVTTRIDGRVEARVRQTVRSLDGAELSDDQMIHVFTITDGLIKRMEVETTP